MMDPEDGQEPVEEVTLSDGNSPEVGTDNGSEYEGGLNPVWEPIRQELGAQFEIIKPHLLEIDKGYHKGITSANQKYEPWKQFESQGITPEVVTRAFATLQSFDQNPEQAYLALKKYLEDNGRLPETPAEMAQAIDDVEDEDELSPEQRELEALRQQLEELKQFNEAQIAQAQQQELERQAEAEVSREYDEFDKAHPNLDPSIRQEVLQRHYLYAASGPENMKSLEEVFAEVDGLRQSFLAQPRPNDTAPVLPGTGGGVPTGQRKKIEEFSREESQDLLAALVAQANQKSQ